jgi:long-chain acyl-CoA synthetase
LENAGVKPRDRVLVLFENSIEFYVAYFGAWQMGAIIAPLNTFLHEKEIHHIINDTKPKAILLESKFAESYKEVPLHFTEEDMLAEEDIEDEHTDYPVYSLDPEELAILLYTSGTTGFPKGVMLSSKNIITSLIQGIARFHINTDERVLAVLPLFHAFAECSSVWGPMFSGATTIVVPKISREEILKGLGHKPTIFLGVPALFGLMCLIKTAPLGSVKYFLSGGDALPDKIRAAFELVYGRKLCNGYGLTETSPVISAINTDMLLPANCVGRPFIGLSTSVRDEEGKEVPRGTIGVLWVKGDNVMLGYYQSPEQTEKVLKDGWLNTGDFARIDEQGRIYIHGRQKDLIINKGFNIYPQEIENLLLTNPAVIAAAIIGKPEPDVGEIPIAFITLREKGAATEEELRALCSQNLASYKIPKQFIILEKMPVTATGKINKKELKAQYLAE